MLVGNSGPAQATFKRAVIDSRQVRPGDLFFALPGEHEDGHDFVVQALAAGATGAVVERPTDAPTNATMIQVSDSLEALQQLAAYWRRQHELRVIAVTGSVGKTTCKELIAVLLAHRYQLLKSEGNLNTEIGVPLTLLQIEAEHQRAILEFAMYGPGEIALLSQIAAPQIGVVTNVGPVHLERLGSLDAIAAAKTELVESLPGEGIAILNGDDSTVAAMANHTLARTVLYGQASQCQVRGSELVSRGLEGITFRLTSAEGSVTISCPLPGRHHIYPCLAAAAVALEEGMTLGEIAAALAGARPDLRLRILPGPNGSIILDDSYNASPASLLAALDLLAELPGRRLALLGEMHELGSAEEEGHRQVGGRAASACDLLLVLGDKALSLAQAAQDAGLRDVRFLESRAAAVAVLQAELGEGDHLLVKASRTLTLETVIEELAAS